MRIRNIFVSVVVLALAALSLSANGQSQRVEGKNANNNTSEQSQFVQDANKRIEKILLKEKLKRWKTLEELQEFESLKQLAKHKELTISEKERLTALERNQEKMGAAQWVNAPNEEALFKSIIDNRIFESYQTLFDEWKKNPTEEVFIHLAGAITLIALRRDINATVKISSTTSGATIKYQTLFERSKGLEPTTAKQPTKCIETMPIGYYYIWTEREGKLTSDKTSKFYIAATDEEVKIAEKQL